MNTFFSKVFGLLLFTTLFLPTLAFIPARQVFAQDFSNDLSISNGDIRAPSDILKGEEVLIYATIHNNSNKDLTGVVKFYDERTQEFISADQPISALAGKTDDVFVRFKTNVTGNHEIAVRVVPWNGFGDDPNNNKASRTIFVDIDSDFDKIGNRLDNDDDNDGVEDRNDAFPFDPTESKDTDGDGIGDNADMDDDGDGVADIEDIFPNDPEESRDTDLDGVGDNKDKFPYDSTEWLDSDGDGTGDNADVNSNNPAPIPSINASSTVVRVDEVITFSALKSEDLNGEIVEYKWNFGDGMEENAVIVDYAFRKRGSYLVTLKVTDDLGESSSQQIQIDVILGKDLLLYIAFAVFLLLILLVLLHPQSKFHHKKLRLKFMK